MQATSLEPALHPLLYADLLGEAELVEELGFDYFLLSEHHFWYDGYCPALLTACGAVAARTRRLLVGTGMLLLPLHDPVRVAEGAAAVDLLSGGRLILGVGLGYRDVEFDGFGIERRQRGGRMTEAIEILRECWTRERVSFSGRHFSYDGLAVTPKPLRPIPIWVGAGTERATLRAARLGCPVLFPAVIGDDGVRHLARAYREEAARWGMAGEARVGVMRVVWVDESEEEARGYIVPRLRQMWREQYGGWGLFLDERGRPIGLDRVHLLDSRVDQAIAQSVIGTPDAVRERLLALIDSGVDILCCRVQTGVVSSARLRRCVELLGREVLPALRAIAARRESR